MPVEVVVLLVVLPCGWFIPVLDDRCCCSVDETLFDSADMDCDRFLVDGDNDGDATVIDVDAVVDPCDCCNGWKVFLSVDIGVFKGDDDIP